MPQTKTKKFLDNHDVCIDDSLVPRPPITANAVEGLVKLLCRIMSGGRMVPVDVGRLEEW